MTISKRDARMLLILLDVIIFIIGYAVIYNPYTNKAAAVEAETAALQPELTELRGYYANLSTYYDGIDQATAVIDTELAKYPTDVRQENLILYATDLADKSALSMTQLDFTGLTFLQEFQTPSEAEDGTTVTVARRAYSVGETLSGSIGYDGAKKLIDAVAGSTDGRASLEELDLGYDSSTGQLQVSATVNKYFVYTTGDEYAAANVPVTSLGTSDLFGTVAQAETATTETATAETAAAETAAG